MQKFEKLGDGVWQPKKDDIKKIDTVDIIVPASGTREIWAELRDIAFAFAFAIANGNDSNRRIGGHTEGFLHERG